AFPERARSRCIGGPHAHVVEEHERYTIVEKVGRAGEIVRELDPRIPEPARDDRG
ncbi:MAG: hypothetical protein QOG29_1292, partial [Gaiellaceae bacterium]|nr:hypothetical protein [Gaiellaceae bacterium]